MSAAGGEKRKTLEKWAFRGGCPSSFPLALVNRWLSLKLLTWDDGKHRILVDWVCSERPQPRKDIVAFERLTGRRYPM